MPCHIPGFSRGVWIMGSRRVEVEAKIVLPSCDLLRVVEERLRGLGAVHEESVVEEDTYYQHPCRDFAETDEALRIRQVDGRYELTYKGPKRVIDGSKARKEITIQLPSATQMARLLEALGFRPVAVVRKHRDYYKLGDIVVSLDEVEGLGCFLEAEYSGGGGPEEAARAIREALEKLGVSSYESTTKSYLELILESKRKA